jgi:hypothetical protein
MAVMRAHHRANDANSQDGHGKIGQSGLLVCPLKSGVLWDRMNHQTRFDALLCRRV